MRVRLSREIGLYAIRCADTDLWLAGLLTEANRARYLAWHPDWVVVA